MDKNWTKRANFVQYEHNLDFSGLKKFHIMVFIDKKHEHLELDFMAKEKKCLLKYFDEKLLEKDEKLLEKDKEIELLKKEILILKASRKFNI